MPRRAALSLLIALVLLAPAMAQQGGTDFAGMHLLLVPARGLDYMAVFFHEIGHTVLRWVFGYPAFPTFDWQDGGGMTYGWDRLMGLQYLVWLMMACGVAWLWHIGARGLSVAAGICAAVFAALSFSATAREAVCVYMGHGAEIMIACFCLLRGLTGAVEGNKAVERWLNTVFGFYTLGRNALLGASLFSPVGRAAYDMQKSGLVDGDLRTLATLFRTDITHVALFSFAVMAVMLALTLWAARALAGEAGEG